MKSIDTAKVFTTRHMSCLRSIVLISVTQTYVTLYFYVGVKWNHLVSCLRCIWRKRPGNQTVSFYKIISIVRAFWLVNKCVFTDAEAFPALGYPAKLLVANGVLKYLLDFYLRNKTWFPCFHSLVKIEAKVWENSRTGENPRQRFGFSLICSRILPNVGLGFHQAMKARKACFIS